MDMSQFVKDWKVGTPLRGSEYIVNEACLTCPSNKPVTMEIKITDASLPERGKILIASGISEHEELWAIRMNNSGRIFLYLGTAGYRETEEPFDFAAFSLGLSYNPLSGAISLVVSDSSAADTLTGHAANQWVNHVQRHGKTPHDTWRLRLGCPLDGRADQPPIGWTISANFRFSEWSYGWINQFAEGYVSGTSFGRSLWPDNPAMASVVIPHYKEDRTAFPHYRIYYLAAEGADHRALSAEWHLGVLAGARAMGWKGGAA